jgi:hypothetical protein
MEENPYQTPETPRSEGPRRYGQRQLFSHKRIVVLLVIVFAFFLIVAPVVLLIFYAMQKLKPNFPAA